MFSVKLGTVGKALVAAVAAGLATLQVATQDGNFDLSDLITTVLAVLGTLGVTYAVPNRPQDK